MATNSDYYTILGIDVSADQDEVRRAFRERVRACHPDRVANLDAELRQLAEEKMVRLNEAYAVLRNPPLRVAYDALRLLPHSSPVPEKSPPSVARKDQFPPTPSAIKEYASRERFASREFVSRAACEEFETRVKQVLGGHADWTPVALPRTTLALRATLGRSEHYFMFAAPPQLDEERLHRFLRQMMGWSDKRRSRWWRRVSAFGFLGAVEFVGHERLCQILERFNRRTLGNTTLGPVTMVDLANWQVFPGQGNLDSRLRSLLRD
jgi:curved DNA-binding protein CbpA